MFLRHLVAVEVSLLAALGSLAHHCFGCAMKDDVATTDEKFLAGSVELLVDLHHQCNIELAADRQFLVQVFTIHDSVDGRTEARTDKLVVHLLTDNRVLTATLREDIRASRDLTVSEERRACHRVIPIAIEAAEGKNCGESGLRATLALAVATENAAQ